MKQLRSCALIGIVACSLFAPALLGAQEIAPQAQPSEQELEEQYIQTRADHGDSHASGMRPELGPAILGNPTQSVVVMRVALYYSYTATGAFSEFASLSHPFVEISNTAGDVHIVNKSSGKQILAMSAGTIARVTYDGASYNVSVNGVDLGAFGGPIFFKPTDALNRFRVESIRRTYNGTKVPSYRGAIEVSRGPLTADGRVNLVNYVPLEGYVPGVVANESIASWHVEALKAQAVAARGYAVANLGRYERLYGYKFDLVDSSSSQVYRGVISEHPNAVRAASETIGLVASYNGQIITAMYSSSMGGHTENYEWIFNSPNNMWPGTDAPPYLRGIYDGDAEVPPDLFSEAGIAAFWTAPQPTNFDDCLRVGNRFSRWRIVLSAGYIKGRMVGRATRISGDLTGNITDVELVQRMEASARVGIARVTLTSGVYEIRGWDALRQTLGRSEVSTPVCTERVPPPTAIAKDFVLNNPSVLEVTKTDGIVTSVTSWGGGWGHNVGLSQYGSQGRARAGQNFLQILKAYYTGVDIGAYPIDIGREPGSGPPTLRQQFSAPRANGTLVIRASGLEGLRVHINETYDLSFDAAALGAGTVSVDVSAYLTAGINTIQYNPVGRNGTATVTVSVE